MTATVGVDRGGMKGQHLCGYFRITNNTVGSIG